MRYRLVRHVLSIYITLNYGPSSYGSHYSESWFFGSYDDDLGNRLLTDNGVLTVGSCSTILRYTVRISKYHGLWNIDVKDMVHVPPGEVTLFYDVMEQTLIVWNLMVHITQSYDTWLII